MKKTEVEVKNEIVLYIDNSAIADTKKQQYKELLSMYCAKIDEYEASVDGLVIKDINDTDNMKIARDGRLLLKSMRIQCADILTEKRKDVQKEMEVFTTEDKTLLKLIQQFDDKFKNLETKLLEKEKFAEKQEQDRKEKLKSERVTLLQPFAQWGINPAMYDLANMPDDVFGITLAGIKVTCESKIKEAEEKERQRLEEIEAEKERQRLRDLELAELKKQNEEKEREAEVERKKLVAEKELQSIRMKELWAYNKHVPDLDFSTLYLLEQSEYAKILSDAKSAFDEAEKIRLDEIAESQRKENEAKEQREKETALLKEAQEKADAIIREQKEEEAKELAERERLESGSDKERLVAYATTFRNEAHGQLTLKTQKANHALTQFKTAYKSLLDEFDKTINKL